MAGKRCVCSLIKRMAWYRGIVPPTNYLLPLALSTRNTFVKCFPVLSPRYRQVIGLRWMPTLTA